MKRYSVRFAKRAVEDFIELHCWIENEAGVEIADRYLARIEARCHALDQFPLRGTSRPELGRDTRSFSFERRFVVLYRVDEEAVTILRAIRGQALNEDVLED